MITLSLTTVDNESMAAIGCAQCGGPLPADRTYAFFCSEACQQVMDAYIVARLRTRPKIATAPILLGRHGRAHV